MGDKSPKAKAKSKKREEALEALTKADDERTARAGLENDVHALLQVHDELIYEVRESKSKEVAKEIERIMESVVDPKDTKGVIMRAEAHIGKNWGELK